MKTNIAIICMLNEFNKKIAVSLADKLDLYSVDVADYMAFNMINEAQTISACGVDYLKSLHSKVIKDVSGFENTVISLNPSLFLTKENQNTIKQSAVVIYLKMDEKVLDRAVARELSESKRADIKKDLIVYDERNKSCEMSADIITDGSGLNEKTILKNIIKSLDKFFK